jgi:hypothetical protein
MSSPVEQVQRRRARASTTPLLWHKCCYCQCVDGASRAVQRGCTDSGVTRRDSAQPLQQHSTGCSAAMLQCCNAWCVVLMHFLRETLWYLPNFPLPCQSALSWISGFGSRNLAVRVHFLRRLHSGFPFSCLVLDTRGSGRIMAATMQALAAKPFVGQDIKLRARSTPVAAVRAPVTVRASQQEQEAVGGPKIAWISYPTSSCGLPEPLQHDCAQVVTPLTFPPVTLPRAKQQHLGMSRPLPGVVCSAPSLHRLLCCPAPGRPRLPTAMLPG